MTVTVHAAMGWAAHDPTAAAASATRTTCAGRQMPSFCSTCHSASRSGRLAKACGPTVKTRVVATSPEAARAVRMSRTREATAKAVASRDLRRLRVGAAPSAPGGGTTRRGLRRATLTREAVGLKRSKLPRVARRPRATWRRLPAAPAGGCAGAVLARDGDFGMLSEPVPRT